MSVPDENAVVLEFVNLTINFSVDMAGLSAEQRLQYLTAIRERMEAAEESLQDPEARTAIRDLAEIVEETIKEVNTQAAQGGYEVLPPPSTRH